MKRNEKKLLLLAGVLFALVVVVRLVPLVADQYRAGREQIGLLEEREQRYRELIRDTASWQEREALKQAEIDAMSGWVFEGSSPSLIGSSVQRAVRQAAEETGISIRETSVARYGQTGEWLLVTQDLNFTLEQRQILPFLAALDKARPRLHVAAFNITRNRRQYSGSITVVGFGRTP